MEIGLGAKAINKKWFGVNNVLILDLVEIGLGAGARRNDATTSNGVLILVLVEIGLGGEQNGEKYIADMRLNPCFSGNRFGSA